jgi:hypothetical protein
MFTYGLILRRSAAGVLRVCIWCASGVHLVCIWCASGVHLVCIWCASGVHLVCIWCAAGVLRVCCGSASGVHLGVTNDFFLFFIATFYRVKTLLTMLRIRDPDLGVIQRQEIAAHKHQTHTPISMDFNVIIYDDG